MLFLLLHFREIFSFATFLENLFPNPFATFLVIFPFATFLFIFPLATFLENVLLFLQFWRIFLPVVTFMENVLSVAALFWRMLFLLLHLREIFSFPTFLENLFPIPFAIFLVVSFCYIFGCLPHSYIFRYLSHSYIFRYIPLKLHFWLSSP
jgi:hypothetical protein